MSEESTTTHFGYQQVPIVEKSARVRAVFDSVATRYDLMNDLMSLGVHRFWKRQAIALSGARRGQQILDLAAGTGDLSERMARIVGPDGYVVMSDINAAMLTEGRRRLLDRGQLGAIKYALCNAEQIPFLANSFNCVTIGFGLRNVTNKEKALAEMFRVLKPGGRALILEFSKPTIRALEKIYDLYSFSILPTLGKIVVNDEASYRYLAESIRMHPDQKTLRTMMEQAGFERCDFFNQTGGIVAIHRGFKL